MMSNKNIYSLFQTWAVSEPGRIWLRFQQNSYTTSNVLQRVNTTSEFLKTHLSPRQIVGVLISNPVNFTIAYLACQKNGLIFSPFSQSWNENELETSINSLYPDLIICDPASLDILKNYPGQKCTTELINSLPGVLDDSNSDDRRSFEETSCLFFTSGTTDTPNIVRCSDKNLLASARAWDLFLKFSEQDTYLNCLPLNHAGGFAILQRSIYNRFSIKLYDHFDADGINQDIDNQSVSHISLVSTMLGRLLGNRNNEPFPDSLHSIVLGGGPVSMSLTQKCKDIAAPLVISYGMTETCSGIAGWKVDYEKSDKLQPQISSGRPFDGVSLSIEKDQFSVSGPMVMQGYLNQSDVNGTINSGDYGSIDNDGFIYIQSRREDLIVSGGENINPREIENFLLSQPEVQDVAVVGIPDAEWGQKLCAVIESITSLLTFNSSAISLKISNSALASSTVYFSVSSPSLSLIILKSIRLTIPDSINFLS